MLWYPRDFTNATKWQVYTQAKSGAIALTKVHAWELCVLHTRLLEDVVKHFFPRAVPTRWSSNRLHQTTMQQNDLRTIFHIIMEIPDSWDNNTNDFRRMSKASTCFLFFFYGVWQHIQWNWQTFSSDERWILPCVHPQHCSSSLIYETGVWQFLQPIWAEMWHTLPDREWPRRILFRLFLRH